MGRDQWRRDQSGRDPIYYDASYYLAPDGKAGEDVYAVLREAIEKTGRVALSRVVIGQRERTIALRTMDGGLVAHTLNEQSDINPAKPLFEDMQGIKTDPDMVGLAVQLIDLMAALRKSLGGQPSKDRKDVAPAPGPQAAAKKAKKPPAHEEIRRQPALKLPIEGGGKKRPAVAKDAAPQPEQSAVRARRKA